MEIINMYDSARGKGCKIHLEKELTKDKLKGEAIIWGHKSKIVVKNFDTFHEMAQEMNIKDLKRIGSLHYIEYIDDNPWTICLETELRKDFLDKYGENYNIS